MGEGREGNKNAKSYNREEKIKMIPSSLTGHALFITMYVESIWNEHWRNKECMVNNIIVSNTC